MWEKFTSDRKKEKRKRILRGNAWIGINNEWQQWNLSGQNFK